MFRSWRSPRTATAMPYQPSWSSSSLPLSPLSDVYRESLGPGEIRLLVLEGPDSRNILQCRTEQVNLSARPAYTAISYTWDGNEKLWYGNYDSSPKPVLIDRVLTGITQAGIDEIESDKVANILNLMWLQGRSTIWIDRICINQEDAAEKNIQLQQMGDIYNKASKVVTVLGAPNKDTDMALTPANWDSQSPFWKKNKHSLFRALRITFMKDYWKRTWILQELTLAQNPLLCCGNKTLDFTSLTDCHRIYIENIDLAVSLGAFWPSRVWTTIQNNRESRRSGVEARPFDPTILRKRVVNQPFLQILAASRQFSKCADPRDLLFARLPLASDAAELLPFPDVTQNVEEMYTMFAANSIRCTRRLDIILYAQSANKSLPSWVPDWTSNPTAVSGYDLSPDQKIEIETIDRSHAEAAMAALKWSPETWPEVSHSGGELLVSGRVLKVLDRDADNLRSTMGYGPMGYGPQNWMPAAMGNYQCEVPIGIGSLLSGMNLVHGDMLCVLKDCPALVFLRPVQEHYVLVGKRRAQKIMVEWWAKDFVSLVDTQHRRTDETGMWADLINNDDVQLVMDAYKRSTGVMSFLENCSWSSYHSGGWVFKSPEAISQLEQKTFVIR